MGRILDLKERIGGITVVAWASVMGDAFDCGDCKRPPSFLCPKRDHMENETIMQRIADSPLPKKAPMIFRAEAVNICPRFLFTPFASFVTKVYSWWEKGSLGVDMLHAPAWIDEAFRILETERSKAREFKYQQNRKK